MFLSRLTKVYQRFKSEYQSVQVGTAARVAAFMLQDHCLLHAKAVKWFIAVLIDSLFVFTIIFLYRHLASLLDMLIGLKLVSLFLLSALMLFILSIIFYRKAGLIQIVLWMLGLGLGFGYGSRFSRTRKPTFSSDYDLGVFALRPVRLHHKKDPQILAARIGLMLLTWKKVDLKYFPSQVFIDKEAILLITFMLERLLLPVSLLIAGFRVATSVNVWTDNSW